MKKSILFVFFILSLSITSLAQTKPTKQETIDWITAQLRNNKGVTEAASKAEWKYIVIDNNIKSSMETARGLILTIVFSFDDICSVTKYKDYKGSESLEIKFKNELNVDDVSDNSVSKSEDWSIVLDWSKTDNLYERLFKAFSTLATYNCPPAKNTF